LCSGCILLNLFGWLYPFEIHHLFLIFASILCLSEEIVSPDVFAHFYVILGSAEFYNAIKQRVLQYQMLGIIEALESAASVTKDPEDILMIDLDNQGKCKIMTKEQIEDSNKLH
jgi:hypothetical protein